MAISNSASPEMIWGLGGPEEDNQLYHCCWTGRVSEREEEEDYKKLWTRPAAYYELLKSKMMNNQVGDNNYYIDTVHRTY